MYFSLMIFCKSWAWSSTVQGMIQSSVKSMKVFPVTSVDFGSGLLSGSCTIQVSERCEHHGGWRIVSYRYLYYSSTCMRLGANGARCYTNIYTKRQSMPWTGYCLNWQHRQRKERKSEVRWLATVTKQVSGSAGNITLCHESYSSALFTSPYCDRLKVGVMGRHSEKEIKLNIRNVSLGEINRILG